MTEREGKSRVALLGYGYAGRTFHAPLIAAAPALELALVASTRPEAVRADLPGLSVTADPREAIAAQDIDLIVIATPNDSHHPLARAALEAGKHVVVDKPFTLDLMQARDLDALAAKQGKLLSVFHNRRWDSDFLSVQAALASGRIGTPVHLESHFDRFRPQVRQRWREGDGPGAGIWFDLGPHLVDQALLLMGLPDAVQADLARQRPHGLSDDWAHVVLHFGERRALLHASMLVAGGSARFTVHGTAGSLVKRRLDQQESQLLQGIRPGDPHWGEDEDDLLLHDAEGRCTPLPARRGDQSCYYREIAAAIAGEGRNPVPPIEALGVMAVMETAARSAARNGAALPLALGMEERERWAENRATRHNAA